VNWSKVRSNSIDVEISLNKLNYLLGKDDLKKEFCHLYSGNPDIVRAIPVLIAVRESALEVFDVESKESLFYDFKNCTNTAEDYFSFLENTGALELFKSAGVKNLVDYIRGVEVGLDSNGRKNRGGLLMERIVESYISDFSQRSGLDFLRQATARDIKKRWGKDVRVDRSERSFDFALFNSETGSLTLLEVNFYNGGGSKLKAVCGEFKGLHDELKEQGINFVWITDGLGWKTALRPLEETYNHIDYLFNLRMLEEDVLTQINY